VSWRDWWKEIKELWGEKPPEKPWLPPHSWPHDKPLPPPPKDKK